MRTERAVRLKAILCAAVIMLLTVALVPTQGAQAAFTTPPIPTIVGPITTPGAMYLGLVATTTAGEAPENFGYLTQEYFVSGTANGLPYVIRILVRSPELEDRFSGIVVSECMHSNGNSVDFGPMRLSIMVRGHIHVEIAAQAANVTTLKGFNSTRYAMLNAPASQTSEIIAQVGTLIKSNLVAGPLYPLHARRLILMGTSQASAVVRSYQSLQFTERMPDGSSIFDGYFVTSTLGNTPMPIVDVPMVQMPTQTEVTSAAALPVGIGYRRPDSDQPNNRFRIYEVAGMSHANTRDTVSYEPNPCVLPMASGSEFPWGAMAAMGLNHLVEWVDHGKRPPHAPYIAVEGSLVKLDVYGNAEGGVRNTYVDVPVAKYGIPNSATGSAAFICSLAGYQQPLSPQTLEKLYKDGTRYVTEINWRLMELVREGWFLPEYVNNVWSDALKASTGLPLRRGWGDAFEDCDFSPFPHH